MSRRSSDFVLQQIGDELLVYDQRDHHAHSLHRVAAHVFRRCDGRATVAEVAAELAVAGEAPDAALVVRAVEELRAAGLLAEAPPPASRPSLSRRDALKRVGLIAGAAVAMPLVQSIVAPTVAQAASCGTTGSDCCPGNVCNSPGDICLGGICQPNT